MIMNDEQQAAYRAALEEERVGNEARVKTCESTGDTAGATYWTNLIQQVDDEIARVDAMASVEETVDEEPVKKKSSAKASA